MTEPARPIHPWRRAALAAGLTALGALSAGCAGALAVGDDAEVAAEALASGRSLFREGAHAAALAALARACADESACRQSLAMIESCLLQRREPERGIELLTRIIERHPSLEAAALGHRGYLLEQAVELERAEQDYQRSLTLDADPLVAERLGSLRMRMDDHEGALAAYRAGLRDDPRHVELRFLLARTLRIEGRFEEARQLLEAVLSDDPTHGDVWANLGRVYLHEGRPDEARTAFRQAIASNPRNIEARYQLTKMALAAGDTVGADALVREIRAIEETFAGRGPRESANF